MSDAPCFLIKTGGENSMILTHEICKCFDGIQAIDRVSTTIKKGSIYGIIGTNGAGKSTFLRILTGILKPDEGYVQIDGEYVFENVEMKQRFFYISDEQHFFPNSTPFEMARFYELFYPNFSRSQFEEMLGRFGLEMRRKISTFSKGMKKQLSVILALSANTDYIFCDETFDGLDPVMRQAVKSLFAQGVADRELTAVIASHNLREIEDICDHVGLLHRGGVLFSRDLEDMKLNLQKVHFAIDKDLTRSDFPNLDILSLERRGSLYTLTARGSEEHVMLCVKQQMPIFSERLPLSLEEIFISETEVVGYDIQKIVF